MKTNACFVLFKNDFRIEDNAALASAYDFAKSQNCPIIGLYCHDQSLDPRPMGAASLWWLKKSLTNLEKTFTERHSRLICISSFDQHEFEQLLSYLNPIGLFYGVQTNSIAIQFASKIKQISENNRFENRGFLTAHLFNHGEIKTQGGGQFRVFSPFCRAARKVLSIRGLLGLNHISKSDLADPNYDWRPIEGLGLTSETLDLGHSLTPSGKDWAHGFNGFVPGEKGAQQRWRDFIQTDLSHYAQDRDRPDLNHTSRLSPYLRFGEISPHRLWADLDVIETQHPELRTTIDKFRSEVLWREFSYELLDQFPNLHNFNIRNEFNKFPWKANTDALTAWQKGETGYELVDAGMKELRQTGFMHNRVRMIAASFLIKHLMIDWRHGEAWFWDCLVDADPANNPASWQWVAGSGADAAPYFRIFNPITAAEKFDPEGHYRERYLGSSHRHDLFSSHKRPLPIIDHMVARERALKAFQLLKS
jgi:deoxyribodipyrimidine photo-lyase